MDGKGMERIETVVIGAGQAGLSTGYYLKEAGRSFVIVDAHERVGDSWLSGMTPQAVHTGSIQAPGMAFPREGRGLPTKDEMIDYLESYASRFDFPMRTGLHVDRCREGRDGYVLSVGGDRIEADNVIVASGADQDPRVPSFSRELDPAIVQFHSSEYRNPSQLREGGVLVVGAGNSGADVSFDVVGTHPTWLSGPDRGHVPVDIDKWIAQNVAFRIIRFVGLHVMTIRTPIGRKAKRKFASQGDMFVRVKPKRILAGGVERVPKTVGVAEGSRCSKTGGSSTSRT